MRLLHFGARKIGPGQQCFIIAEAGVNHNGNLEMALELVKAAKKAGADAVKFQTFVTEKLIARGVEKADYQKDTTGSEEDQAGMLKKLELSGQNFQTIFSLAKKLKFPIFSTPDEVFSADMLSKLGVELFKIGSGEVTNLPFLRHIAGMGKPIVLSTGMSTMAETAMAFETLVEAGAKEIALLHCVSAYPAPYSALNLNCLATLKAAFDVPIGFSDHSTGNEAAIAAVALGACIIEKHFTLDKNLEGPDHRCSLDPDEFKNLVQQIRNTEQCFGKSQKQPDKVEKSTRKVVRKGLVAARRLKSGKMISARDIDIKRTSPIAILPAALEKIIGLSVHQDVEIDSPITWEHLKKRA